MKNHGKRISCMIAVMLSIVMLLASFATPVSAANAGSDPILSGGEYGISYENGVYTLSINANKLVEILQNRDFNKETLLEIMPVEVYELLTSRDPQAAISFLQSLMNETSIKELKNDLPLDLVLEFIDENELKSLIKTDKIKDLVDIEAFVSSLSDEEFFALFKEGALEELLGKIDLETLFDEQTRQALLENLTTDEIFGALKENAI